MARYTDAWNLLSVGLTGVKCSCPGHSATSLDNYTGASPLHRCTIDGLTGAWLSVVVFSRVNCTGVSPIAPVLVTSDQPVLAFFCCRLCASVKSTKSPLCLSVQPVCIPCVDSCAVFRVCFRIGFRLFLGLSCVGVAPPWLLHAVPRTLGLGVHLGLSQSFSLQEF